MNVGYGVVYPKEVFVGAYSPSRRLCEFSVQLSNVPGAIAKVSEILAKMGINVLSGFHVAETGEKVALWSFIVDLTGLEVKSEELLKKIKGLKVVLDAHYSEAKLDGLMIDEMHFPLNALGKRSFLFRVETWGEIINRLFKAFGSGAAFILFSIGEGAGENKARSVTENYGSNGLKALQIILAERVAKGWGVPKVEMFDEERVESTITIRDLFECLPFKGKSKETKSHFFRGYLTGVFRQLFKKDVEITEVECVAKGDENCKFIIR
jgi:predicted hydrocarbon binding protein